MHTKRPPASAAADEAPSPGREDGVGRSWPLTASEPDPDGSADRRVLDCKAAQNRGSSSADAVHGAEPVTEEDSPPSPLELSRRLASSARLSRRRLVVLPVHGEGAVVTEVQGRGAIGRGSLSPADLDDLISSIGTVGMLQPVLLEELPDGRHRLVAGERRLRAVRWGAVHDPENPHFGGIPAVVAPGPLSDVERRLWQISENLAREPLRAGELGAALLFERCAVLQAKLLAAGVAVPVEVASDDDAVRRWRRLERLRGTRKELAAPWTEVLRRLGVRLSPRKAREVVAAFAALPVEVSSDMDAEGVATWARLEYARLDAGRHAAAAELWAAVRQRARPQLLGAAASAALSSPGITADAAIARAEEQHQAANQARGDRLRRRGGEEVTEALELEAMELLEDRGPATAVPAELVDRALEALRALVERLRAGERLERYTMGSLRLYGEELLSLLGTARGGAG